ncbi:MAG: hypothetical protein B7Z55_01195, partial [Planctomycetales bacterium 12-60-4]
RITRVYRNCDMDSVNGLLIEAGHRFPRTIFLQATVDWGFQWSIAMRLLQSDCQAWPESAIVYSGSSSGDVRAKRKSIEKKFQFLRRQGLDVILVWNSTPS